MTTSELYDQLRPDTLADIYWQVDSIESQEIMRRLVSLWGLKEAKDLLRNSSNRRYLTSRPAGRGDKK